MEEQWAKNVRILLQQYLISKVIGSGVRLRELVTISGSFDESIQVGWFKLKLDMCGTLVNLTSVGLSNVTSEFTTHRITLAQRKTLSFYNLF